MKFIDNLVWYIQLLMLIGMFLFLVIVTFDLLTVHETNHCINISDYGYITIIEYDYHFFDSEYEVELGCEK